MRQPMILSAAILLFAHSVAQAQWSTSVSTDNLLCSATGPQVAPVTVSDGAGGAIAVWNDVRVANHRDVFVQRINAAGFTLWDVDGVRVDSTVGELSGLSACSDDSNGVIIAWVRALGPNANRVWVQRVDAHGQLRWGASGVAAANPALSQDMPRLVRDGSGGALVLWANWKLSNYAVIRGQRLNRNGVRQWSAAGDSIAAGGEVRTITVVERPAGGAYIGYWQSLDVPRVAAIRETGAWVWNGAVAITAAPMSSVPPALKGAASGAGVIFTASGGNQIHARRIGDVSGTWATDVRVVSGNWFQGTPAIASDGADGAILAWADFRTFSAQLRSQRLRSDGTAEWVADGVLTSSTTQGGLAVMADDANGAWLTWNAGAGSWAQHVSGSGTPWLPVDGVLFSDAHSMTSTGAQLLPAPGSGVIVVASNDGSPNADIWAKRLFGNGQLGTLDALPPQRGPSQLRLSAGPNPCRGSSTLRFSLPHAGHAKLEVFGLRGERLGVLLDEALPAGEHVATWNLSGLSPGIHHARLSCGSSVAVVRFVRVE